MFIESLWSAATAYGTESDNHLCRGSATDFHLVAPHTVLHMEIDNKGISN